jgi:hypothetical protein
MTSAQVIRKFAKERFEDPETQRVAAIEFTRAFSIEGTYREIYHVVVTHEYSQETTFEVFRVTIDDHEMIVAYTRVFMS